MDVAPAEQQPGDGSLTEGGTDAAVNVLDPVNLIQGLHCILGEMVLQDSIQGGECKGPHSPTPSPAAVNQGLRSLWKLNV